MPPVSNDLVFELGRNSTRFLIINYTANQRYGSKISDIWFYSRERRRCDNCDERAVRTILAQDSQIGLPNRLSALALASPLTCYGIRNTVTTSDIPFTFLTRSFLFFFSLVSSSLGNLLLLEYLWFIAVPRRDIILSPFILLTWEDNNILRKTN
jgi:hypothetical protein